MQLRERPRDSVVICRKCNQLGHYARGCALIRRSQQGDSDLHSSEQHAQPTSINNITGYYFCACVLGVPVSFLVDTGAGVLLLNGNVWDKFKSAETQVEPTVYHNLVGVDGHPIKVRGSVTLPVVIAGKTFQQEFIIAECITAESILGVDFMQENNCVVDQKTNQCREVQYCASGIYCTQE